MAEVGILEVKLVGSDKLLETLKLADPDVLIDFTQADAAVRNVKTASSAGVSVVVGTTGFTPDQKAEIENAVKKGKIGAVVSPNMSVGVNAFFKIVSDAARMLGPGYSAEIVETHHVHKRDAPSGTARRAAQLIAREWKVGEEKIPIKSIREGEVVGDHTVKFSGPVEDVEIIHRAKSREIFSAGAVKAARFVVEKGRPGVVQDMWDVLGITK